MVEKAENLRKRTVLARKVEHMDYPTFTDSIYNHGRLPSARDLKANKRDFYSEGWSVHDVEFFRDLANRSYTHEPVTLERHDVRMIRDLSYRSYYNGPGCPRPRCARPECGICYPGGVTNPTNREPERRSPHHMDNRISDNAIRPETGNEPETGKESRRRWKRRPSGSRAAVNDERPVRSQAAPAVGVRINVLRPVRSRAASAVDVGRRPVRSRAAPDGGVGLPADSRQQGRRPTRSFEAPERMPGRSPGWWNVEPTTMSFATEETPRKQSGRKGAFVTNETPLGTTGVGNYATPQTSRSNRRPELVVPSALRRTNPTLQRRRHGMGPVEDHGSTTFTIYAYRAIEAEEDSDEDDGPRSYRIIDRFVQAPEYDSEESEEELPSLANMALAAISQAQQRESNRKPAAKKKYKPVDRKVRPIKQPLPESFRVIRRIPSDPLLTLPVLPTHPPGFKPVGRVTEERMKKLKIGADGFLNDEETKLMQFIVCAHESVFAWTEAERGRFRTDYFPPVKFPVVEHDIWVEKNRAIPPAVKPQLLQLLKEKLAAGVYEYSSASYRSQWFCVTKKDGVSVRIVHDLQRLNSVTIADSATLPSPDAFSEEAAGRVCYGALDQYSSFDLQLIDEASRDYTTFQTDYGTLRLVSLPMGYTNAVQIQHGNLCFLMKDEYPENASTFVDDINVLGPRSYYKDEKGVEEMFSDNPKIRRWVWEYAITLNRVLHRIRKVGGSVAGKKAIICAPSVPVTGYMVSYEGRHPLESNVQKIEDWPICRTVTEVRAFLGTLGLSRTWIKGYTHVARPLTHLLKRETPFEFTEECVQAMRELKDLVMNAPCLKPIDYACGRQVTLEVDTSTMAVGFILSQQGEDNKRYPARYGSIGLNERESRYSQAKLELYGLFRALRAMRFWIIGAPNLTIEVDAKYITGMLNHPDTQPNATINRWIAGILLFTFTIVHVPGIRHTGADGLSRRPPADEDQPEIDDPEEWLDNAYGFSLFLLNDEPAVNSIERNHTPLVDYAELERGRSNLKCPAEEDEWTREDRITAHVTRVFAIEAVITGRIPKRKHKAAAAYSGPVKPTRFVTPSETLPEPPTDERTSAADEQLAQIKRFLDTSDLPDGIDRTKAPAFIRKASKYFSLGDNLYKRRGDGRNKLVPLAPQHRMKVMNQAHEDIGHRGIRSLRDIVSDRFWWPSFEDDVKWFTKTCHVCQQRQFTNALIPPTVPEIFPMFHRVHADTMHMPPAGGFKYILQARCALIGYPEAEALRSESHVTIGRFIKAMLCRWGYIASIVTDNGGPFVKALEWLEKVYGIRHITISGYNSRANGVVEVRHTGVRETLMKMTENNESKWPEALPFALWAERGTTKKALGTSPFFAAHGVEMVMPFDLEEATYLVEPPTDWVPTTELLAMRARQLQKRPEDLKRIEERIFNERFKRLQRFEKENARLIRNYDFGPGELVLVRNTRIKEELNRKTKVRYSGPMVVLQRNRGGAYILAELDGTLANTRCAAFRVIPYRDRGEFVFDVEGIIEKSAALLKKLAETNESDEPDVNEDRPDEEDGEDDADEGEN